MKPDEIRAEVRKTYGAAATAEADGACCGPSCCDGTPSPSEAIGYTAEDEAAVPKGANLGLGCGNPQAIAALRPGERVLDLGSGAGFDVFLAARAVGETGRVTGVDMTPEMLTKARDNAARAGVGNVEFRLGEIEHLPVADASVDVVISNCVINLSPDKPAVFREAHRVLVPGGRLAIADIVATAEMPAEVANDPVAYCGCIGGAKPVDDLAAMMRGAGFEDVRIDIDEPSRDVVDTWLPGAQPGRFVASARIQARKPVARG